MIHEHRQKQKFHQETTFVAYAPTKYLKNSGTPMDFEGLLSGTTPTHYHPGERSLYIFTTNKDAGVILNFCGIKESPGKRKDCEVKLAFKKNSLNVLNFPPFTHHKFYGEFVCISIHPREGENIIQALASGTIPVGFLEFATILSEENKEENKKEEWSLSLPQAIPNLPQQPSSGISR
jgi:hypothetical protein